MAVPRWVRGAIGGWFLKQWFLKQLRGSPKQAPPNSYRIQARDVVVTLVPVSQGQKTVWSSPSRN